MKCEHCNNDMVWVGSLRDGKLECETCAALTEYCNKDGSGVEVYAGGIIWSDEVHVCTSNEDVNSCPSSNILRKAFEATKDVLDDDMLDYDI